MGECLYDYNDQYLCKVGTTTRWLDIRRSEAEVLYNKFSHFLNRDSVQTLKWALGEEDVMWQFPFPYQDKYVPFTEDTPVDLITFKTQIEKINSTSRPTYQYYYFQDDDLEEVEHEDMCITIYAESGGQPMRSGGYHSNLFVPCPNSKEFAGKNLRVSGNEVFHRAGIYAERYVNGKPVTIFICGYCGSKYAITEDEIESVANKIKQGVRDNDSDNINKLISRIHPIYL